MTKTKKKEAKAKKHVPSMAQSSDWDKPNDYFITSYSDGSVRIDGGLVFHPINCGVTSYPNPNTRFVITGCYFYNGAAPKWYELRKWWRIIQLIRQYTRKQEDAE